MRLSGFKALVLSRALFASAAVIFLRFPEYPPTIPRGRGANTLHHLWVSRVVEENNKPLGRRCEAGSVAQNTGNLVTALHPGPLRRQLV